MFQLLINNSLKIQGLWFGTPIAHVIYIRLINDTRVKKSWKANSSWMTVLMTYVMTTRLVLQAMATFKDTKIIIAYVRRSDFSI